MREIFLVVTLQILCFYVSFGQQSTRSKFKLAESSFDSGNYTQAINIAIEGDLPGNSKTLNFIAKCHLLNKKIYKAKEYYERSLLDNNNSDFQKAITYIGLFDTYRSIHDYDKAGFFLNRADSINELLKDPSINRRINFGYAKFFYFTNDIESEKYFRLVFEEVSEISIEVIPVYLSYIDFLLGTDQNKALRHITSLDSTLKGKYSYHKPYLLELEMHKAQYFYQVSVRLTLKHVRKTYS